MLYDINIGRSAFCRVWLGMNDLAVEGKWDGQEDMLQSMVLTFS